MLQHLNIEGGENPNDQRDVDELAYRRRTAFRRAEERRARRIVLEYERRVAAGREDADDVFDAPAPRT